VAIVPFQPPVDSCHGRKIIVETRAMHAEPMHLAKSEEEEEEEEDFA